MYKIPICPECKQGKHVNCTEMMFNEHDAVVPCKCTHQET